MRLLFADEVRPWSIYGAIGVWRLGYERHFAFNIFDTVTMHTVAGRYTGPIHTPHYALPFNSRSYTAKPPGKMEKTGGFALAPKQCRGIQQPHWHRRGRRTGVENS
jgi:hypothetical protein